MQRQAVLSTREGSPPRVTTGSVQRGQYQPDGDARDHVCIVEIDFYSARIPFAVPSADTTCPCTPDTLAQARSNPQCPRVSDRQAPPAIDSR